MGSADIRSKILVALWPPVGMTFALYVLWSTLISDHKVLFGVLIVSDVLSIGLAIRVVRDSMHENGGASD